MKNKHWTAIGASYAVFAIAIATLATYQTSSPVTFDQSQVVAQADQSPAISCSRLYLDDQSSERDKYWITIWTIRNCPACEKQKALVPALEEAGYHVIVRQTPGARWIKSFPASVITKDKPGGDVLHTLYGVQDVQKLDEILKIRETPEEEEVDDYDIFNPKAATYWKPEWFKLAVREPTTKKQVSEVMLLKEMGFEIVFAGVGGDDRFMPVAVLIDKRDNVCIMAWFVPFTAEDVLKEIRKNPC